MRKIFRCRGSGGKDGDNLIHFRQLQARIDHAVAAGEPQHAAGILQLRVAAHDCPNGGAIDVGDASEVKDGARLVAPKKILHFLLDAAAVRPGVNAPAQRQHRDAVLELPFGDFENHVINSLQTRKFCLAREAGPGDYDVIVDSSLSYGN